MIFTVSVPGVLSGRRTIYTPCENIDHTNIAEIITEAARVHNQNATEIDYLWNYTRGVQPVLNRTKEVRPEICNKIVENHANEIVHFTSGYFMGEPCTYVGRGEGGDTSEEVTRLNNYMFEEDKASHDKQMATWMAVCGVGYRMILPDKSVKAESDASPFELDTPDPRFTFVIYHTGFTSKRLVGVRMIYRRSSPNVVGVNIPAEIIYCGYTKTHYFEIQDGKLQKWKPHALGDIPIFEYRLNMELMGAFEPAIPVLDAINVITSNRLDGLEQFVQSFMKFINCDIDETEFAKLKELGALKIKSIDGQKSDVQIISQELNQTQTQTILDYLYDKLLNICGMPTTTKGGSSTSDTGTAVYLRDGWSQCESRAQETEGMFKKSEKQFLALALKIIRDINGINLNLSDIECKFTRRQHDNLTTKAQALQIMLECGLKPEIAIATCGLFNDPMDVTQQSEEYLTKWKPNENSGTNSVPTAGESNKVPVGFGK